VTGVQTCALPILCAAISRLCTGLRVGSVVSKAGESLRIAERGAFHYLARTLVVTRKLCTDGKVRTAFQQQTRHGQPRVMELRNGVKDGSLPTDAVMIECRSRIDVGPAV